MKYIIILALFFTITINGQESDYIQDFRHKINVKLGVDSNTYSFKTSNLSTGGFYDLKPNESVRLTTSFQHRFIGLTVGFSPSFLNNNEDEVLKGESSINSIRLRLFIKRFIQEFSYYRIRGFYVDNTQDYVANWQKGTDPYLQINGLKIKNFGGKTSFVINKNFSYKALLVQNEKQTKSAGSFVPSIAYSYSELDNPQRIFANAEESSIDLNVTAGYIHNFVFGKNHNFYSSLGLFPGLGVKFAKTSELDINNNNSLIEKSETHPNFIFDGRLNLGYNSDKFFTGLQFNLSSVTYDSTPETRVQDSSVYFQLFFGYRFNAPKSVERFFDKIYKKK